LKISLLLLVIGLCLFPIAELRAGIPVGYFNGTNIYFVFFLCVIVNSLAGPIVFIFLSTFHKAFIKWKPYNNFFNKFVERARRKVRGGVEKYGYLGLAIFVAIPLPFTGAYTGALGAWILGMEKIKSCLAVASGVLLAGVIVSLVVLVGEQSIPFLFKLFTSGIK